MLSYFGWTFEYFDWSASGLTAAEQVDDYRSGKRVSMLVRCNEELVMPEARHRAVQLVWEADPNRRTQWAAITDIAPRFGLTPQALRFWVRQSERAQG